MKTSHISILLLLEKNTEFDAHLKEVYPYIYMHLPLGFLNIIDCLMIPFQTDKHEINTYLEECMSVVDYCISTDEDSYEHTPIEVKNSAIAELYSYEFYDYLSQIYYYLESHLKNLLATNKFIVLEYDSLNRVNKLLIKVEIND